MSWEIMDIFSILAVGCFCVFMMVCGNASRYCRPGKKTENLVPVKVDDGKE